MGKRRDDEAELSATNARAVEPAAVWMPIGELTPWDRNPRVNDGNVKRVAASIKRFGFASPIIARAADKVIIAGHTRWKAAQSLGLDTVPVRLMDLDPADANLLALADNRLNELSPWDMPRLQELLGEFGLEDAALAGWSSQDLEKMASDMLGDEPEPADDQSAAAKTDFAVLIECSSESEQLDVLAQCESLGLNCRALV